MTKITKGGAKVVVGAVLLAVTGCAHRTIVVEHDAGPAPAAVQTLDTLIETIPPGKMISLGGILQPQFPVWAWQTDAGGNAFVGVSAKQADEARSRQDAVDQAALLVSKSVGLEVEAIANKVAADIGLESDLRDFAVVPVENTGFLTNTLAKGLICTDYFEAHYQESGGATYWKSRALCSISSQRKAEAAEELGKASEAKMRDEIKKEHRRDAKAKLKEAFRLYREETRKLVEGLRRGEKTSAPDVAKKAAAPEAAPAAPKGEEITVGDADDPEKNDEGGEGSADPGR